MRVRSTAFTVCGGGLESARLLGDLIRWFVRERDSHALDDFCNSAGLVVVRTGQFLHIGWLHSHSAGDSDRRVGRELAHGQAGRNLK
jgi:hypothetical protein